MYLNQQQNTPRPEFCYSGYVYKKCAKQSIHLPTSALY